MELVYENGSSSRYFDGKIPESTYIGMYFIYIPWILLVCYLQKLAVKYTEHKAENCLDEPYKPLPDFLHNNLPLLNIRIPDKLLLISAIYTIIDLLWYQNYLIFNKQLLLLLIVFSIRPFFCCLTILPACLPENNNENYYDKIFLSTHDLMFSGHTCSFLFMGKIINGNIGYIIGYILPITLIMAKVHYSIDILVSIFVYNYIELSIEHLNII